jgi:DNA-binding transcriptional LysR family regulator
LARYVGAIPIGAYAHRRYLDRYGMPSGLDELARHRVIGFDRELAYTRSMAKRLPFMADVQFTFRADSNLAQLAAIRAGMGIGLCQVFLVRDDPDIVRVLPEQFELPLQTWVAMHEDLKSSPRCRATFDALVEGLLRYIRG